MKAPKTSSFSTIWATIMIGFVAGCGAVPTLSAGGPAAGEAANLAQPGNSTETGGQGVADRGIQMVLPGQIGSRIIGKAILPKEVFDVETGWGYTFDGVACDFTHYIWDKSRDEDHRWVAAEKAQLWFPPAGFALVKGNYVHSLPLDLTAGRWQAYCRDLWMRGGTQFHGHVASLDETNFNVVPGKVRVVPLKFRYRP